MMMIAKEPIIYFVGTASFVIFVRELFYGSLRYRPPTPIIETIEILPVEEVIEIVQESSWPSKRQIITGACKKITLNLLTLKKFI